MKRKSDNLADSFATDESEGWLARFLADEEELDNRAKWRLASWGAGSLGAIVIAILAGQAAGDRAREQVASADLARQSQAIQQLAKESRNEAGRLASAIEILNGDRDRLYAKLGSLEQGLDSVTGSIARNRAAPQLPSIPVERPAEKRVERPSANAAEAPANMVAALPELVPVESRPTKQADVKPEPKAQEVNSAAALASTTKPVTAVPAQEPPAARHVATTVIPGAATPLPTPAPERAASASSASFVAARSMLAPPDGAAGRLVEPPSPTPAPQAASPQVVAPPAPAAATVASAAAEDDDDTPETAAVPVPRTEFGVDLGSAGSVEGLRVLWVKLAKTHKELKPLRPVIMVKDQGRGAQLRLVAGPLGDAAAAAKLCVALGSADRSCETAVYDGQRLPMASAAPPPRPRKRVPKLTSVPEPPPPPPAPAVAPQPPPQPQAQAQPASFTNFFGIRPQASQ
ncbi:hypothetical protein [Rhodopseudomonas sp. B29]|uniref:hypothetical protein n=1 Tax=Rhodopseudomonas sp. B29 TaxID=95607 RepID=UPI0003B5A487|nr:hypothetical protein [Rhodopseudomonas sp. B29]